MTMWYPVTAGGAVKHDEQILVELEVGEKPALIGPRLLDGDGVSASVVLSQRQAVALLLALGGALGIEIEPEPPTTASKRAFLRLGGSAAVSAAATRARALHLVRSATRRAAR